MHLKCAAMREKSLIFCRNERSSSYLHRHCLYIDFVAYPDFNRELLLSTCTCVYKIKILQQKYFWYSLSHGRNDVWPRLSHSRQNIQPKLQHSPSDNAITRPRSHQMGSTPRMRQVDPRDGRVSSRGVPSFSSSTSAHTLTSLRIALHEHKRKNPAIRVARISRDDLIVTAVAARA
jgi:hypothetical protein